MLEQSMANPIFPYSMGEIWAYCVHRGISKATKGKCSDEFQLFAVVLRMCVRTFPSLSRKATVL